MAGKPWEKYQGASVSTGKPWEKYAKVGAGEGQGAPVADTSDAGRQLGLGTRATIQGIGQSVSPYVDAAGAVSNLGIGIANDVANGGTDVRDFVQNKDASFLPSGPAPYVKPFNQNVNSVLDAVDLPTPQTEGEKVMSAGIRGASSMMLPFAAGSKIASAADAGMGISSGNAVASQATAPLRNFGQALAQAPGRNGVAAGIGSAGGQYVTDKTGNPWLGGAVDVLTNLGAGTVAAEGGRLAMRGSNPRKVADSLDGFSDIGASPTVAQATKSPFWGSIEGILARAPGGATVMRKQVTDTADAAVARLTNAAGENANPADAGRILSAGLKDAGARYEKAASQVYDTAYDQVESTARRPSIRAADLSDTTDLLASLQAKIAKAPETAGKALGPTISRIRSILSDIDTGAGKGIGAAKFDFAALRSARTQLGEDLKRPDMMGVSGSQATPLSALYSTLTQDMNRYAGKWGAGKVIALADRYFRMAKNRSEMLTPLSKITDGEKLTAAIARKDATTLNMVRRTVGDEKWAPTAGSITLDLGKAIGSQQNADGTVFSLGTFLRRYQDLGKPVQEAVWGRLIGGEMSDALRQVAKAAEGVSDAQKVLSNPSGTAAAYAHVSAGTAFILALGHAATGGGSWWEPASVAGLTGAMNLSARAMTSPKFVRWLATTTRAPVERVPALISRLADMAQDDPKLRAVATPFIAAFSGQKPQGQPSPQ